MEDLVKNMYFKNKNGHLGKKQFQSGILVSIKATKQLYTEVKNEGLECLLTSRLNQDALENLFSQVRLMGGANSHPTSVEFCNRIRKLCMVKNVEIIIRDPNVDFNDEVTLTKIIVFSCMNLILTLSFTAYILNFNNMKQ